MNIRIKKGGLKLNPTGGRKMGAKREINHVVGSATLLMGLLGSSAAWAQCSDNFSVLGNLSGQHVPAGLFFPLGGGSSLNALTSTINTVNTAFLTSTSALVSAPGSPQPDQQGGGIWGRAIGGEVEAKSTSLSTLDLSAVGSGHPTGAQTCHTTVRQDYAGYQLGHDISILNSGGTGINWHWGVTAGYLEARTRDVTPGGSFTNPNFPGFLATQPGDFSQTSQVPFAGIYTAFTKGNFFADAQARWDFYQNSLTAPSNGVSDQPLNARGFSLTGGAGYQIPLQHNWFIEPGAGVIWSNVGVDDLNVAGSNGVPAVGPHSVVFSQFLQSGNVHIDDITSVLGRASLSVGTSFTNGPITWSPFFTASVFHEFAGDVRATATILGTGNAANLPDGSILNTKSTGGVGTYAQFALGTSAVLGNTGWLGYARADYRIGDNIDGFSVNTGLRYQFNPAPRPGSLKDGTAPVDLAYNWTGPYIGAFGGRTVGVEHWRFSEFGTTVDPEFGGGMVGVQAGYNVQAGRIVLGVEADYGLTNAFGGKSCPNLNFFSCESEADQLASLAGRLGIGWGHALFYAKAGWAGGQVTAGTFYNNPPTQTGDDAHWRNGWTAGGGMEFALTERWSAKAEYMHYDLGKQVFVVQSTNPDGTPIVPPAAGTAAVNTQGDTVRIGLNLHLQPRIDAGPLK
jgi:opacity protein-like surface antigen